MVQRMIPRIAGSSTPGLHTKRRRAMGGPHGAQAGAIATRQRERMKSPKVKAAKMALRG